MIEVKRLVNAGSSINGAIREALRQHGLTVSAFADKHQRNRQNVSNVISGTRAPAAGDISAFIAEFGGTENEWRQLLYKAGQPQTAGAS